MARILYFGDCSYASTSPHRANALRRLGHDVDIRDPHVNERSNGSLVSVLNFKTGYVFIQDKVAKWLKNVLDALEHRPDIIWVDMGELFGRRCLEILKQAKCPILLYNTDDPTGNRDGRRFNSLLKALPYYDLILFMREETVVESRQLGAKRVELVYRSYDEVEHKPFDSVNDIPASLRSDVAFIGTWMRHEGRDKFMLKMIEAGIPVSIWGNRWEKSPYFPQLKSYWKGGALAGRDYVGGMQGAKICLGMLSKGNRDLYTKRSFEIPYANGLLCAERTSEHQSLYKEGEEAVFWSDVEECIAVCHTLLRDDSLRENIRSAGARKIRSLGLGNEDICKQILSML